MRHRTATQSTSKRRGVSVVEMAFCAPILFFVVFSAVEFAQVNMIRNSADNAAYEGARKGALPGSTSAEAKQAAESALTAIGIQATASVTNSSSEVTVTVSVPLQNNFWVVPKFFVDSTLVRSCTLQVERTSR